MADKPKAAHRYAAESSAGAKILKEGGAHAVKLEGGMEVAPAVKEIVKVNVPVVGHLGLTPQAVHRLGGYKVQGRRPEDAERILTEARVLEGAGVCAVVLECVPVDLAREVSKRLQVPTIGIGAGPHCDGQVLVSDDMLGLTEGTPLKFVKRYADLRSLAVKAVADYCREVRDGEFPGPEHSFTNPA
ncbi:MAG: 3-methyl-2-oxobutanoate hydroxymethyltransferase [Elusimicrobia bacterium]|nr:3-methyl-2-oxobutanoate hydroxymethyltransferase [Elusimicrobiota bacterium]